MDQEDLDRRFLLAAVEEIDDYLSSTLLNWPLNQVSIPLTPGNLLLCISRVNSYTWSAGDEVIQKCLQQIQQTQTKRSIMWEEKISLELPYRIRLWENSVNDFYDEGTIDSTYATAVKDRVIIALLLPELRFISLEYENKLEKIDNRLKNISTSGIFIWDSIFDKNFSAEKFWFLYLRATREEK